MCAVQETYGSWRAPGREKAQQCCCYDSEEVFSLFPVKHKLLQFLDLRFSHLSFRFTTTLTSEQVQPQLQSDTVETLEERLLPKYDFSLKERFGSVVYMKCENSPTIKSIPQLL